MWSWSFFIQSSLFSSGPVPLTIPCYFCHCIQYQIPLDAQLGCSQPVPASTKCLHTTLLRRHYANHFLDSLIWSYLQTYITVSPKNRPHFSSLTAAWIIHWQLLTLNQRLATVLSSRLPAPLAIPPTSAPVRNASASTSVTSTPALSRCRLCTSCQHLLQNQSPLPVRFCQERLHRFTQLFRFRKTTTLPLSSHSYLLTVSFSHFCVFAPPVFSFSIWLSRCTSIFIR